MPGLLRRRRFALALPLALLLGLVALRVLDVAPLEMLRLQLFDYYQQLRPRPPGERSVVIVQIDEESLRSVGQWPWPRNLLARLVSLVGAVDAKVIGFNVLFAEPDRLSPGRYVQFYPWLDPAVRKRLGALPSNDELLAESFGETKVVLGVALGENAGSDNSSRGAFVQVAPDTAAAVPSHRGLLENIATLRDASRSRGLVSLTLDRDGVVRRVPSVVRVGEHYFPSLAVEMLRVADGASAVRLRGGADGIERLSIGRRSLPTDGDGGLWLYLAAAEPAIRISAARILSGDYRREALAGKLVLIGATAAGLGDVFATASGISMAGVEVQAQLLAAMIDGQLLRRPVFADAIELIATAVSGLVVIALWRRLSAVGGLLLVAGLIAALAGAGWIVFSSMASLFDATFPMLTLAALYGVLVSQGFIVEQRARREAVRRAAIDRQRRDARLRVLQAELAAVGQASALGEMATAIAHELNQPLAAIMNYIDASRMRLSDPALPVSAQVVESMDKAFDQAERAGAIIKELRQIFGKGEGGVARRPEDINDLVEEACALARTHRHAGAVEIVIDAAPAMPPVPLNRIQIQQVVVNLVRNGFDALTGVAAPRLVVATGLGEDGAVRVSVRDNGPGIAEEVMDRVFRPFASTKQSGMGMGLSICKTIAEAHGGAMAAYNNEDVGATFVLSLPVTMPVAASVTAGEEAGRG